MKNGYILNSSILVILWFILMLMNINTKFKPKRKSQQQHNNKDFPVLDQRLLMSNTKIEACRNQLAAAAAAAQIAKSGEGIDAASITSAKPEGTPPGASAAGDDAGRSGAGSEDGPRRCGRPALLTGTVPSTSS